MSLLHLLLLGLVLLRCLGMVMIDSKDGFLLDAMMVLKEVNDEHLCEVGQLHVLIEHGDEQFINEGGSIDWRHGVDEIEFDDSTGKAFRPIHRPTGGSMQFDVDTAVDSSIDITSNRSNTLAAVCKGGAADEFIKKEEATKMETKAEEKASLGDLESNPKRIKAKWGDVISGNFDMEEVREHKRQKMEAPGSSSSSSALAFMKYVRCTKYRQENFAF